jgi:hypothetical protein
MSATSTTSAGAVKITVIPRMTDFPTPLTTERAYNCTCSRNAADRDLFTFMASASKNGEMDEARRRFGEFVAQSEATNVPLDQAICCSFLLQLLRENDIFHSMKLLRFMIERNVSRTWRFYDALLKRMRVTAKSAVHGDNIIEVLRTVPISCKCVISMYGTHQASGIIGLVNSAHEDRYVDGMRLFDLLLDTAFKTRHLSDDEDFGIRYELRNPEIWGVMLNAATQRHEVVQAIAIWRAIPLYCQASGSLLDMLARNVCHSIDHTEMRAIGWAADEPLLNASPAAWFEFVVDVCLNLTHWRVTCASQTLSVLFLNALQKQWQDKVLPLVRAALDDRERYEHHEGTYGLMMRVVSSTGDRALEPLAHRILAAARADNLMSRSLVGAFVSATLIYGRTDAAMALFEELKVMEPPFVFDHSVAMPLMQASRAHNQKNFAAVKRTFDDLVQLGVGVDSVMLNALQTAAISCGDLQEANRLAQLQSELADSDQSTSNTHNERHTPSNMHSVHSNRVQLAAANGDFDGALRLLAAMPTQVSAQYMREVITTNFAKLLGKLEQQQRIDALPTAIQFAQAHEIEWTEAIVVSIVRLCHAMQKIDFAIQFVDMYEQAAQARGQTLERTAGVRTTLLASLRDSEPQKNLPLMIHLLNKYASQGALEASFFTTVAMAAFRANEYAIAWQIYEMMMAKAVTHNQIQLAGMIQDGVRTADELLRVMNDYEARGVTPNAVVWTNAFTVITKRIRSPSLGMQLFERMCASYGDQPPADPTVFNAALNCLDDFSNVEKVLAYMRSAQIQLDSFSFHAIMSVCRRAREVESAESTMIDYLYSDAGWFEGIVTNFEATVGRERARKFEAEHAERINVKRCTPKSARSAPPTFEHQNKRPYNGESRPLMVAERERQWYNDVKLNKKSF